MAGESCLAATTTSRFGHYQTAIAILTFLGDKNKIDSPMLCAPILVCVVTLHFTPLHVSFEPGAYRKTLLVIRSLVLLTRVL